MESPVLVVSSGRLDMQFLDSFGPTDTFQCAARPFIQFLQGSLRPFELNILRDSGYPGMDEVRL